jgi:Ni,Fe-hydrogenase III small subunit
METDNEKDLGFKLQKRMKEVLGHSLHIRHVDSGSCNGCDFEMNALNNPYYDIQRFGVDFVASPRHADMLLVTGGVTRHLEQALRKTYQAASHPKMVVAIGACAVGGGMFGRTYANYGGVDQIVPVYVYVPGCPPRPEAILEGILLSLDRYEELMSKGE